MKVFSSILRDTLIIFLGSIIYALGITFFVVPGSLITGGTTGIALFVNRISGFSISIFMLLFNGSLFLLGLFILGKKFAATAAFSTFLYPISLEIIQRIFPDPVLTSDPILCALFGGACIGISIGLVIRSGSSTGGMDIPPLILNKLWRIPVSVSMYLFDFLILLLQAASCSSEQILYGIVLVMVYSFVIDKCIVIGSSRTEVKIISEHSDAIRSFILSELDRGVTILDGHTGFLDNKTEVLLSILSNRELPVVERKIRSIDPNAFLIVSKVTEVRGRGFSEEKKYL